MTTLSQRIAALKKQRGEKLTSYEAVLQRAIGEDRDISEEEQTALDAVKEDIDNLDRQVVRLEASEQVIARSAVPVTIPAVERDHNRTPARPNTVLDSRETKGWIQACRMDDYPAAGFTRMAIAMALAGPFNAHAYALQRWGSAEFSDLVQRIGFGLGRAPVDPISGEGGNDAIGAPGGGASLIAVTHLGSEFIEMLRAQLILGRLPRVRRLSFSGAGTLVIPKQTAGVSGGYVGEGMSIRVQRLNFGQMRLTPSKLAVIVPTTNELLRRSDPSAEQIIRDDLLSGTARTMDLTFLSSVGAVGGAPAGILTGIPENVPGRILPGMTPIQLSGAMKAMVSALRNANIPMVAPAWIMNPRTKEYLRLYTTDLGVFPWKAEIDQGVLLGYPIIDSTTVPLDFGGVPGDGIWILLDAAQLLFAEDLLPTVDASEEASIQSDDAPGTPPGTDGTSPEPPWPLQLANPGIISAFQQDMLFMRLRSSHTWGRRYDAGITWAITKE